MSTFISEPGTRLGGRYRLEDRVNGSGGWLAWKAIDETLARPVAVLTFAPGFPRVGEVVTAARAASRLTDARLAQVFDVEDTWDQAAYVVMEWVASDSLDDLLTDGPLDPGRAAEIIAEGAEAMASAHAAGLAHLCLNPGSLRWSPVGGVKIAGVGIDAALAGITANDPVVADTRGLGRLLYAALTAHWPGPDWPGLPPAPEVDGHPRAPHQVRAGIPAALDDIACQALFQQDGRRGGAPLTTPGLLADALAEVMPAPMLPPPAAIPGGRGSRGNRSGRRAARDAGFQHGADTRYDAGFRQDLDPGYDADFRRGPDTAYDSDFQRGLDSAYGQGYGSDGGYGSGPGQHGDGDGTAAGPGGGYWDHGAGGPGRPFAPPGHGRPSLGNGAKVLIGAVAVLVVAVVAVLALRGLGNGGSAAAGSGGHHPATSAPPKTSKVGVLTPASAHGFDAYSSPAQDSGNENDNMAASAIDGNPKTSWQTQYYFGDPAFGGLKPGTGLILDMRSPVRLASVQVQFGSVPGANVRIEVGNSNVRAPATLSNFTTVASASDVSGSYTFQAHSSATGRYVLVWFTKLPPRTAGSQKQYQAEIFNIVVRGSH